MIDLTSLVFLGATLLGLIIGDAALYGRAVRVDLSVPQQMTATGFSDTTAEALFLAELNRVGRSASVVATPNIESAHQPSILSALGRSLNLDPVVMAVQARIGVATISVYGAIVARPDTPGLEMYAVLTFPNADATRLVLNQPDGDPATLIQRMARQVSERVAPYRTALADYRDGLDGETAKFDSAREAAETALSRPWIPSVGTQRVMLHNLLAMMALVRNDREEAERQFDLSDPVPDAAPASHGTVMLNRAFLAVVDRDPEAARNFYHRGRDMSVDVAVPHYHGLLNLTHALVLWSERKLDHAEAMLRQMIAALPNDDLPYLYLAALLRTRGRLGEVAPMEREARARRPYRDVIPALAITTFTTDPSVGGYRLLD